jgi:hypothetical protein
MSVSGQIMPFGKRSVNGSGGSNPAVAAVVTLSPILVRGRYGPAATKRQN